MSISGAPTAANTDLLSLLLQAAKWAYPLHPDGTGALAAEIANGAVDRFLAEANSKKRSVPGVRGPNKIALSPEEKLLQAVFAYSERWEIDQEMNHHAMKPRYCTQMGTLQYQPTVEDLLVRYLKFLLFHTLELHSYHVAIALGCFLWRYEQEEILQLGNHVRLWPQSTVVRNRTTIAGRIGFHGLYRRFRYWPSIFKPSAQVHIQHQQQKQAAKQKRTGKVSKDLCLWRDSVVRDVFETRRCSSSEYNLIENCLQAFVPPMRFPRKSAANFLKDYFLSLHINASDERLRYWLLIGAAGAGLTQLIDAFNTIPDRRRKRSPLGQPRLKMEIPDFRLSSQGQNQSSTSDSGESGSSGLGESGSNQFDRFILVLPDPSGLGVIELQPKRREGFHAQSSLWVEVDGERIGTLSRFCSFDLPASPTSVEVWGEDEHGPLLLAAFSVDLMEDDPTQAFVSHLEGGQEVALYLSETEEKVRLGIFYNEHPSHVSLADLEAIAEKVQAFPNHPDLINPEKAGILLKAWYHFLCCHYCRDRIPKSFIQKYEKNSPFFLPQEGTGDLWGIPFYLMQKEEAPERFEAEWTALYGEGAYRFACSFFNDDQVAYMDRTLQFQSAFRFWLETIRKDWVFPFLEEPSKHINFFTSLLKDVKERSRAAVDDVRFWVECLQQQLNCYVLLPSIFGSGEIRSWEEPANLYYTRVSKGARQTFTSRFLDTHANDTLHFYIFRGLSGEKLLDKKLTGKIVSRAAARAFLVDTKQLPGKEERYFIAVTTDLDFSEDTLPSQWELFVVEVTQGTPALQGQATSQELIFALAQEGLFAEAWKEAAAALRPVDERLFLLFLWGSIFAPMKARLDHVSDTPGLRDVLRDRIDGNSRKVQLILETLHQEVEHLIT